MQYQMGNEERNLNLKFVVVVKIVAWKLVNQAYVSAALQENQL